MIHDTSLDHEGALGDELTDDHVGSPERLAQDQLHSTLMAWLTDLRETTSQPRATAYLHILDPRNPFPPATTIFLRAAEAAEDVAMADEALVVKDIKD